MGKKNQKNKMRPRMPQKKYEWNFVSDAGPGCHIARRDLSPEWMIEWEDLDPEEFEGEPVPDIALDVEEQTLTVCNLQNFTQIAYVTVYETRLLGRTGQVLTPSTTTDNQGVTQSCITFIVLCPSNVFAHLCFLDVADGQDISQVRIESDVREWNQHPLSSDEHPQIVGFPLEGGPFLCTQGENGELTHFFSGNLHAMDFRCPIGTPLLAVGDGVVVEAKDSNTLTGIAVSNLFKWNSIILQLDTQESDDKDESVGPLFIEYVHIQESLVKPGERVTKDQIIGKSGSVGFSPEPHLHFSAFRSSDPEAPTVRVRFGPSVSTRDDFLPKAGTWYGKTGPLDPANKE
jgi:hypothetical protein